MEMHLALMASRMHCSSIYQKGCTSWCLLAGNPQAVHPDVDDRNIAQGVEGV